MPRRAQRGPRPYKPPLRIEGILRWADAHHRRSGRWPTNSSGPIAGTAGETWSGVYGALYCGGRGLDGRTTLSQLLTERRGVRNSRHPPKLTNRQVLEWLDAHRQRRGEWPTPRSGAIREAPGETWAAIEHALFGGGRGFSGGSSMARLLAKYRGHRNAKGLPRHTQRHILAWADAHHRRTGRWPNQYTGPVVDAPGETWSGIQLALAKGLRGLRGGGSLTQFLARTRGVRNRGALPRLTRADIVQWADEHRARTGRRPTVRSGTIPGTGGETWSIVGAALSKGGRGWPGGYTLPKLLAGHARKQRG